jgi:hypothetical protein
MQEENCERLVLTMAEYIIGIFGLSIIAIILFPFILVIVKYLGSFLIKGFIDFCETWVAAWRYLFKGE